MDFGNLNANQIEAVKATEGYVRIVAGAGAGKTKVLAHRYAYLVNEYGINPANILCLTFTNKAAQEMRTRIKQMVPEGFVTDFICTLHGFCVKFLREEIFRLGYPRSFLIIDTEDMKSLAKEVLKENDVDRSDITAEEFLSGFSKFKRQPRPGYYVPFFLLTTSKNDLTKEEGLYVQLLAKQHKLFALDFDDLIFFTLYIFGAYPDVLTRWQEKMNYIMVDEVQDCSLSDWKIFVSLSKVHHNLFIVGDPDQCIYEWRGAAVNMFLGVPTDTDIILDRNYRSTTTILDAANSIIDNNVLRIKKDLYTKNNQGTVITHYHGKNEQDESDWTSRQIKKLVEKGASFSDFAVLVRASYLTRSIEQSFLRHDIGYVIWGGIRFFERQEIKDALGYLRLVAYDDGISFKRIANVPSRKIGKVLMAKIGEVAEANGCSMFEALKQCNEAAPKESITSFIQLIEKARAVKDEMTVQDLLVFLLRESGVWNLYRDDVEEGRLDNLNELVNSVKLYQDDHREDEVTLETYLQDIALYTNADYQKDRNHVKIMTIHQAKGLEFPYVFVAGLSEGIFPNRRSIRERKKEAMEEERRLMYVAVTRAEKLLFLTESEGFSVQGQFAKYPSRFLTEIKQHLFVTEGEMDENVWNQASIFKNVLDKEMEINVNGLSELKVGSAVIHPVFNKGTIVSISKDGQSCEVEFEQFGRRNLLKRVLSLPVEDQNPDPSESSEPSENNAIEESKKSFKEFYDNL